MPRSKRDNKKFRQHSGDLLLLNGLRTGRNISQRTLALRVGKAPSQVNRRIAELLAAGYVEVVDATVRPFAYRLTPEGRRYCHELLHRRFEAAVGSFQEMKEHIGQRLREIAGEGIRRLVFYGAGEVMEVAVPLAEAAGMDVVGLVDDDPLKVGRRKDGLPVQAPGAIRELMPDAVLITTFRHAEEIRRRMETGKGARVPVLEL